LDLMMFSLDHQSIILVWMNTLKIFESIYMIEVFECTLAVLRRFSKKNFVHLKMSF